MLVPRLLASGADRGRVFFADDMTCGKERRQFDPARDIQALEAAIATAGGAAFIMVDPVVSAVAGDSHKNAETRRALQPLVDLAAAVDAALIGVTHLSKGTSGRDPVERINGSLAFAAIARIVMIAAKPEPKAEGDLSRRVLMRAKSNIGRDNGGFSYELFQKELDAYPGVIAPTYAEFGEAIEGTGLWRSLGRGRDR